MSIKEHKWYDGCICETIIQNDNTVLLDTSIDCVVFNKKDSLAIANHFGYQDRETLVNKIKALIEEAECLGYSDVFISDLIELINEDLTSEEGE